MPIGLDLGASTVRMLQFAPASEGLKVQAAGQYTLPDEAHDESPQRYAELIVAVKTLLSEHPFAGRRAVISLPEAAVTYKNLRLPKMPPDELRQAITFEAGERFNLGTHDSASFQHIVAGEVTQGEETRHEVIVIAVKNEVLDAMMNLCSATELDPAAIDVSPSALARCFGRFNRREVDSDSVRVFVDIGYANTKVLILCGNRIRFYKDLATAGRQLDEAVAAHLNISLAEAAKLRRQVNEPADESQSDQKLFGSSCRADIERAVAEATRPVLDDLAKEIGLCQRYHSVTFRGSRSTELTLCGAAAHDTLIADRIADKLELHVTPADPLAGMDLAGCPALTRDDQPLSEWAVAAGLAMRQSPMSIQKRGAA